MNFDDAIKAHVNWKLRLAMMIAGKEKLDAAVVGRDDLCELGKWIHGEGARFATLSEYVALKKVHVELHETTARIVRAFNEGRSDEAKHILEFGSAFSALSTQVVMAIIAVQQRSDSR